MNIVSKNKLKNLIEPHFFKDLKDENYQILDIKSKNLLTPNRFDLAFKLLYLEMLDKDVKFAKEIYKEHIKAFSLGKFIEPGNEEKNSIEKFENEFINVFYDIKSNGFDNSKTFIPLSKNSTILNGAHRVASCIYLDKNVSCVKLDIEDAIYDYEFFYKRGMDRKYLDIGAIKFVEYLQNPYIAFIWPSAKGKDEEIEKIIPNIIYKKSFKLNQNGAHNLMTEIYNNEAWLGNFENHFRGADNKVVECFKDFDSDVRVYIFTANNLDEVLKIKEDIRKVFGIGKHSIHITDTKEEAMRVANIVFNDNSIHFLNYAKPTKFISNKNRLNQIKQFIEKNNLNSKDIVFDSSIVLSMYGLREAKDIDFLSNAKIDYNIKNINNHDEELKFYQNSKDEIIYNPKHYFYFNGIKFISFDNLYKMKQNRSEIKDKNDCKMMEAMIENNLFKEIISKIKQKVFYTKAKFRQNLIEFLKKVGLFEIVRNLYKAIKNA